MAGFGERTEAVVTPGVCFESCSHIYMTTIVYVASESAMGLEANIALLGGEVVWVVTCLQAKSVFTKYQP